MFRKAFPARAFATFSFFEGGRGDFPAGLCRSSVSALTGGMGGKRRGFRCVPEAPAWLEVGMCEGERPLPCRSLVNIRYGGRKPGVPEKPGTSGMKKPFSPHRRGQATRSGSLVAASSPV